MRTIGLMSGTSIDGIDAALVRFDGGVDSLRWEIEAFRDSPYRRDRRDAIRHAITGGDAQALCDINVRLGEWFAEAALELCAQAHIEPAAVTVIGSHGHTIWHRPPQAGRRGATLQLGCAATIAERTAIDVVSDFRSRDVAAGGHGAPLVPFADRLLFAADGTTRILVNAGGMANLTRVPPRGAAEPLLAFDTGPGNALVDAAVAAATAGRTTFDRDGERARRGTVDEALLAALLEDPFFALEPPRSTGREAFGEERVRQLIADRRPAAEADWDALIATLTELTARSIEQAVRRFVLPRGADELVLTGGGARNHHLVSRVTALLQPLPVRTGDAVGIAVDAKEAVAFAALAWAHVTGVPGNVPEVTGAAGPRVLGCLTPGRRKA
jgi:anhydro-N-acetylmuramic acid kinase